MANSLPVHLNAGQIQRMASEYLQELAQYYDELQDTPATIARNKDSPITNMLDQRVHELLKAMTQSDDPQQKREDIIRVLCGHKKRH